MSSSTYEYCISCMSSTVLESSPSYYVCDACMCYLSAGAPNYYPNSFSGPRDNVVNRWSKFSCVSVQINCFVSVKLFTSNLSLSLSPPFHMYAFTNPNNSQSGDIERYRTDDDDNFTQVL